MGRGMYSDKYVKAATEENKYFPTWGEFLDFAIASAKLDEGSSANRVGSQSEDWTGTRTFADAVELARNGWPEGEAKITRLSDVVVEKVTELIELDTVEYDVEGQGIDIGVFVRGEPECWQHMQSHTVEGPGIKHVRICFDATVSGGMSRAVLEARGAAVAALVKCLEYTGARVQLEVLPLCHGKLWESRVLVKAADQELDMSRVAFALLHPAMLRRLGFAVLEGCPIRAEASIPGYGPIKPMVDRGDICIDGGTILDGQWTNEKSAIKWVLAQIKAQGIHIKDEA